MPEQQDINIESRGDGHYLLSGVLSFQTVPQLWKQGGDMLDGSPQLLLDLAGVSRTDSAGIALLVEWLRMASERNARICFQNIPPQMLAIARVSGLDDLLPIKSSQGNSDHPSKV